MPQSLTPSPPLSNTPTNRPWHLGLPRDWPVGLEIEAPPSHKKPEEEFAEFLLDIRQQMKRLNQQAFDFSHPVDEYVSGPGTFIPPLEIMPTYELFSERIEFILIAGFPANATGVVLQLGERFIPIDTTRGTANGGLISLDVGIVLKRHERRTITFVTNGPTAGYFVGLFGHASDIFETV